MTLAPDLLTALGMTALSAWCLAWVMWLLGRQHWQQGMAQAIGSMLCFGAAYFFFGLESRVRHSGLQLVSLLCIGLGVSYFTLALQRFRQSQSAARDRLTVAFPALITLVIGALFLPESLRHFNRLHAVLTISQMCLILVLLQRMRASTPGTGWILITSTMVLQTLALLPMVFVQSQGSPMAVQAASLYAQLGRWMLCMTMFVNLVITSMGFLLMLRDRQSALDHRRAQLDSLTQLPARHALIACLQSARADCAAQSAPLTVLMLDIDHFKSVNDRHGHLVGDRVIQMVAQHLQKKLRGKGLAARYGGKNSSW